MDRNRKQVYEMYRSRVVDEDRLINNRVSWMLGAETITLAFWGVIYTDTIQMGKYPKILTIALFIVSIAGFYVSFRSKKAIEAAHSEINSLVYKFDKKYPDEDPIIPRLTGSPINHKNGHIANRQAPLFFMFIWSFLIILSVLSVDASLKLSDQAHRALEWLAQ